MHAINIVDLFAGPGGLDVAARELGLPVTGIEWDADACATRQAAGLLTRQADVRELGPADFPAATVLAGGPPCQTYTVAGSGTGRRALDDVLALAKRMAAGEDVTADLKEAVDERTGLVLEPLRWALEAVETNRPYQAIVLEQVPAVLPVWEAVGEALDAVGYATKCAVLRTEEYGVPQTRRRAILIARRNTTGDREFTVDMPPATHRPYRKGVDRDTGDPGREPWVPMGKVVKRPVRYEVVSNYGTGGDPAARGRRTSDEPSATVTGKISRNRIVSSYDQTELERFTLAEAGQLQTFPADYPWSGRNRAQQIGNAIPPRLAAHVLASALDLGEERLHKALSALGGATA
ncbi:DNA cytosine methyltransferase [Streptomyces ficellus]|uniref:DNA (cytosine-5-)-methyltransferase n=1 Tax=Streptomyces ficellus TaxID=1977088 RepID=A0ABT7Z2L4_9ACTN|nr:DNA cytosine methyltransferase [Streptomyces ficellus]MDN3293723.1 DNA cytosine methyltransferase [Streptomyces ficellus]